MMRRVIKSLFPSGHPWRIKGVFGDLVDAIGDVLNRVRDFLIQVRQESNAGTADITLEQWYAQLDIRYDPTRSIRQRRRRARQAWAAIGGQNPAYLRETIQVAFPDVDLRENLMGDYVGSMAGVGQAGVMQAQDYPSWTDDPDSDGRYQYLVEGSVETTEDFESLENLIEKIMPAHLTAVYQIGITNAEPTAEAGLAQSGFAQAGRLREGI